MSMVKKITSTAITWAICLVSATAVIVNISKDTAVASETEKNTNQLSSLAEANNNCVFLIGSSDDNIIPKDFSVSDYVLYYKEHQLGVPVCGYFHRDEASEESILEIRSHEGEKVTVQDDMIAEKAKIEFEHWDAGRIVYDFYTFDFCPEDVTATDEVLAINYEGIRYTILTYNEKFYVSKLSIDSEK